MVSFVYFDIYSDFAFFKKPDINKTSLTYNLPPKPAILGIIGSVLGMSGISKQYENNESLQQKKVPQSKGKNDSESTQDMFPEFYRRLEHLKIGIKPIGDFPFNKITNTYNSRNSYFGNEYENIPIHEQLLIRPTYRIYIYEQTEDKLVPELVYRLKNSNPIFMPYLGKNEFIACFTNINMSNDVKPIKGTPEYISSIFLSNKENIPNDNTGSVNSIDLYEEYTTIKGLPTGFRFLENYPTGYSNDMHYNLQIAQFTERYDENYSLDSKKGDLFEVNDEIVYLF